MQLGITTMGSTAASLCAHQGQRGPKCQLCGKSIRLGHPMLIGTVVSTIFGAFVVYLILADLFSYIIPPLAFWLIVIAYFPFSILWSPTLAGIMMKLRYRNTDGFWWYTAGWAVGFPMAIAAWLGLGVVAFISSVLL